MYIAWFYPPGREKIHALGALDMALWDIKGKASSCRFTSCSAARCAITASATRPAAADARGCPPGAQRLEPAASAPGRPSRPAIARFAWAPATTADRRDVFNTHERVRKVAAGLQGSPRRRRQGRRLVHRLPPALRLRRRPARLQLIEEYEPYFVEDPVRDEHAHQDLPKLRQMTTVPLTHGEEWGQRYDFNKLVENHDIDYIRATLPNVGGITEMMKIAAICETHAVGIIPHFTGPIATAALVNCLSTFPGPVIMEYNYGGRPIDYLPECLDFKDGKAYGTIGRDWGHAETKLMTMIGEVTQPGRRNVFVRPDGSLTHW